MELGTFGAILGFALALEAQAANFYAGAASGDLAPTFGSFAERCRERLKRLERARRELISEMILESITGLDGDDYQLKLSPDQDRAALLCQGRMVEETIARFYREAAARMPIREVVRLFKRMAEENDERRALLADH